MVSSTSSNGGCPGQSTGLAGSPANPRVRTAGPSLNNKHGAEHPTKFRVASLNVGTLKNKEHEVVETLTRRRVDLCCLQETRLAGGLEANQSRVIKGKDSIYKLYWTGNKLGQGGVAILLAESWMDKVFQVQRISDRILLLKLVIGKTVFTFISLYAPQIGRPMAEKVQFYDQLQAACMPIPSSEVLFCLGDWNGHVGAKASSYEDAHGGHGFGSRNAEGERILEFALANYLLVGNTRYIKRDSHLITYYSGDNKSQVDYVLYPRSFRTSVTNVKVIPGEECASQHRLLVCDLRVYIPRPRKRRFVPRLRAWKLRDPATAAKFHGAFRAKVVTEHGGTPSVEAAWSNLKTPLLEAATEVCGLSCNHQWKKETWWWNDRVESAVAEKRARFKAYNALRKQGNTSAAMKARSEYHAAKRFAKRAVWHAKN